MPPKKTAKARKAAKPKNTIAPKGGWVYAKELTPKEKEVKKAGFPWVSISNIRKEIPLGRHSHHSKNTHLIIDGRITFFELKPNVSNVSDQTESNAPVTAGGRMKAPRPSPDENTSGVKDNKSGCFDVDPGQIYQAALSKCDSCSFVEGHECLSPTTRDRFIVREDIKWDPEANATQVGKVMDMVAAEGDVTKKVLAAQRARKENARHTSADEDVDGLTEFMGRL